MPIASEIEKKKLRGFPAPCRWTGTFWPTSIGITIAFKLYSEICNLSNYLFFGDEGHYIFYGAIQNVAQDIDGMSTYICIGSEAG